MRSRSDLRRDVYGNLLAPERVAEAEAGSGFGSSAARGGDARVSRSGR